ncbi:MAG TPA: DUF58 domain-containing protein [Acidimicrobiales bacterium]|nr:DUF58 domain-containing protein [Acidimicrobiales bacterium]
MPTRGGWLLGLSSAVAGAGGRLLGLRELFLIAAGGGALSLCALAYVRVRRFTVHAGRRLVPGCLPVGGSCQVELTLTNGRRRRSPVLDLHDGSRYRFLLDPLDPAEEARGVYMLEALRRGLLPVGPLRARLRDPFGLAARAVTVLPPGTLTVHPRVEPIGPPPDPPGVSVLNGPRRTTLSPGPGGDFHALRPYQEGDDLRLVHWPTSARLDALVVRQEEAPLLRQTAIALDLRRSVHDQETIERAVSAAASVAAASCGDDGVVRLVTTGAVDTGTAGGEAHVQDILDLLATVDSDDGAGLGPLTSVLGESEGATVVLVTTSAASAEDLRVMAGLRPRCPQIIAVVFGRGRAAPVSPPHPAPFDAVVRVDGKAHFGDAWAHLLSGALVDQ